MHAYLEKAYNFGFSRGGPRCPPPDRGFGTLGPSENDPNFLKRRYAAQEFFSPGGARKKARPYAKKMDSNPGSNPGSGSFGNIFDLIVFKCTSPSKAEA